MNALAVHVVIPARNEQELIRPAVTAVVIACRRAERELGVRTTCVVVADSCTDDTAHVAEAAGAHVLVVQLQNVGAARRAGIVEARRLLPAPDDSTWIACTDADSVVPPDWLTVHLYHRHGGADVVLGSVHPRSDDLPACVMDAWLTAHQPDQHQHLVYGANMSFSATGYALAGGFAPLTAHEDRRLLEAFLRLGLRIERAAAIEVETSGRLTGRTPEGFATYLHALRSQFPPDEAGVVSSPQ